MQSIRGKQKPVRGGGGPRTSKDSHMQSFSKSHNYQNNMDLGIFKKEDISYIMSRHVLGNEGEFTMTNDISHLGLIRAISPHGDFGLIYSRMKENSDKYSESISNDAKVINFKDIKKIIIRNVNPNECLKSNFTDGEIARQNAKTNDNKDLVPFFPNDELLKDETLDTCKDTFSPAEMYQVNEENFNVVSTFDPELSQYTVPVDKSDPNYEKLEEICKNLAQEFGSDSEDVLYANIDNEEVISSVVRAPENNGNHGKDRRSNTIEAKKNRNDKYRQNSNNQRATNLSFDNSIKSMSNRKHNNNPSSYHQNSPNSATPGSGDKEESKTDYSAREVAEEDKKADDSADFLENKMIELDLDAPPFEPEAYQVQPNHTIPIINNSNEYFPHTQIPPIQFNLANQNLNAMSQQPQNPMQPINYSSAGSYITSYNPQQLSNSLIHISPQHNNTRNYNIPQYAAMASNIAIRSQPQVYPNYPVGNNVPNVGNMPHNQNRQQAIAVAGNGGQQNPSHRMPYQGQNPKGNAAASVTSSPGNNSVPNTPGGNGPNSNNQPSLNRQRSLDPALNQQLNQMQNQQYMCNRIFLASNSPFMFPNMAILPNYDPGMVNNHQQMVPNVPQFSHPAHYQNQNLQTQMMYSQHPMPDVGIAQPPPNSIVSASGAMSNQNTNQNIYSHQSIPMSQSSQIPSQQQQQQMLNSFHQSQQQNPNNNPSVVAFTSASQPLINPAGQPGMIMNPNQQPHQQFVNNMPQNHPYQVPGQKL